MMMDDRVEIFAILMFQEEFLRKIKICRRVMEKNLIKIFINFKVFLITESSGRLKLKREKTFSSNQRVSRTRLSAWEIFSIEKFLL